ncbi:hypothetical protein BDV29DRAFT_190103 [Aspergillus leporis]|uniref:NB-ARC domain-containing protein n=1 Tax=Aspergillus leporis TaxID=41062 RepID=A0A5N5X6A1_9EURO|nr:hypothetical protein BDV29DRAFT_190103 [Aspergillus leporis]
MPLAVIWNACSNVDWGTVFTQSTIRPNRPKEDVAAIALHFAHLAVSIVAVHGLSPKSKEKHLWLRNFLPDQLPRARIFLSHRPVLFIVHRLGGIVSLVQARLGAAYKTMCESAIVIRAVLRNPNITFLKALKTDDLYAREISSNFQQLLENYRVCLFVIIELAIWATGVDGEQLSLRIFNTMESTLVADETDPKFFIILYPRNPGFIDREPTFRSLRHALFYLEHLTFESHYMALEESAIELTYRFSVERPKASVIWVHASSIPRFQEGYRNILDECNVSKAYRRDSNKAMLVPAGGGWVEQQLHEWLLIIDNADEASLFTSEGNTKRHYLPECPHCSILITTRDRAAGVKFIRNCAQNLIEVGTLTQAESASLMSIVANNHPEELEMGELAGLLDHLPLVIVQATAFMEENTQAVSEYIELYNDSDETQMDLLCEPFEALGRDTEDPNALVTTLIVSINHIKERDSRAIEFLRSSVGTVGYGVRSMEILANMFPNATFENWTICGVYFPHVQSVLRFIPELHLDVLKKRGLYLQRGMAYYLWSQGRCNEAEELDLLILEEKKQYFDQGRWPEAERLDVYLIGTSRNLLGPHHDLTLTKMSNLATTYERKSIFGEGHEDTIDAMAQLGSLYLDLSKLEVAEGLIRSAWYWRRRKTWRQEAEELITKTIREIKKTLGSGHSWCPQNKSNLVDIYMEKRHWDKAEELLLQVLEGIERNRAVPYDILPNKQTLLTIYWHKGHINNSEKLASHPFTLKCKYFVAMLLRHGNEAEATQLLIEVTNEEEDILGAFHDDTLISSYKYAFGNDSGHANDDWEVIDKLLEQFHLTI